MSIGTGVVLFVLGAIATFGLADDLGGGVVNLDWIGYILMLAGAVVFFTGLVFMFKRRSSIATTRTAVDPATGERIDRRETVSDLTTVP